MTISDKKFVSLTYELRLDSKENQVFEKITEEKPLNFIIGVGRMLPNFEKKLINLKKGDDFEFSLAADQAYGKFNEKAVIDAPMKIFIKDGKVDKNLVQKGKTLQLQLKDGRIIRGIVKDFNDEKVTIDLNHPLAGKDLFFSGKIIEVRDSTKEELKAEGHDCDNCDENK